MRTSTDEDNIATRFLRNLRYADYLGVLGRLACLFAWESAPGSSLNIDARIAQPRSPARRTAKRTPANHNKLHPIPDGHWVNTLNRTISQQSRTLDRPEPGVTSISFHNDEIDSYLQWFRHFFISSLNFSIHLTRTDRRGDPIFLDVATCEWVGLRIIGDFDLRWWEKYSRAVSCRCWRGGGERIIGSCYAARGSSYIGPHRERLGPPMGSTTTSTSGEADPATCRKVRKTAKHSANEFDTCYYIVTMRKPADAGAFRNPRSGSLRYGICLGGETEDFR